tara:strand:- start:41 stop:301 length:261 start_codon:yes stop_codon:yes gene_type:complete
MKYYIVTKEVFDTLDKSNISFMKKSINKLSRLIATTDTVSDTTNTFSNINECSTYTFTNNSDWVGDGTGVETWEIEQNSYISELDD